MFTWKINEHIDLKLLEHRDAEPLFHVVDQNRDYLRQWLPWVDKMLFVSDYYPVIDLWLKQYCERDGFQVGILYKGEIVGMAGYHGYDRKNHKTTIGYWLSKKYQGKGIMTSVVSGLMHHAFDVEKMNRVEIRAAVENKKSRAIAERLGLKEEGIIRGAEYLYDHYVDHVVYSMLKSEWRQSE